MIEVLVICIYGIIRGLKVTKIGVVIIFIGIIFDCLVEKNVLVNGNGIVMVMNVVMKVNRVEMIVFIKVLKRNEHYEVVIII